MSDQELKAAVEASYAELSLGYHGRAVLYGEDAARAWLNTQQLRPEFFQNASR